MSTLIDDGQTIHNELTETAIGTNPTHSQLAKDHDDHHFHELAAKLAMHAVKEVGKYMSLCLNSESDVSPVSVAKNFLRHPNDMATLDSIVLEWAKSNPEMINRGESRHIAEHLSKETTHIIDRVNNNLLELKQKLNSFNILKND
jgi:hypothetical protein